MKVDAMGPGSLLRVGGATAEILRGWSQPTRGAIRVGLSGGIGSGKSTVAQVWADQGARVVSADAVARDVVVPGSVGLQQVVARFGVRVLDEDGTLNRQRLAGIAFSSEDGRRALEAITHPLIAARVRHIAAQTPLGSVFVYDVPLLVEAGLGPDFDCVVMVSADEETRLGRLEQRGLGRIDALARMRSQASLEDRRAVSNIWIENHGDERDIRDLASAVYGWLGPLRGGRADLGKQVATG